MIVIIAAVPAPHTGRGSPSRIKQHSPPATSALTNGVPARRASTVGPVIWASKKTNRKIVRPAAATLPDAEVLGHVRAELELSGVDVKGVMVAVHAGEVVLDGEVPTQDDKLTLEQRLAHCRGVVSVRNQLTAGTE